MAKRKQVTEGEIKGVKLKVFVIEEGVHTKVEYEIDSHGPVVLSGDDLQELDALLFKAWDFYGSLEK